MIAAYSPSAVFAALINPIVINVMITFAGVSRATLAARSWIATDLAVAPPPSSSQVFIPFAQITAFWRYWCVANT